MLTLTLSRGRLSLPDLVIDSDPFTGSFHLPENGLEWPRFETRRTYAPASEIIPGRTLLSALLDVGTITATIYAHGDTAADVLAAMTELEDATTQWGYEASIDVDGERVGTWQAHPEAPAWGPIDTGHVRARFSVGTVVIPVNPT